MEGQITTDQTPPAEKNPTAKIAVTEVPPAVNQSVVPPAAKIETPAQNQTEYQPENFESPTAGAVAEARQVKVEQPSTNQPEIKPETAEQNKTEKSSAEKPPEAKEKKPGLKREMSIFPVSLNDKAFLAKNLATILKAGISLPESLRIVQKQSHGKLSGILSDVISKVEGGKALNVALSDYKKVFDPLFINMVKVGEKSGTLDESLHHLSVQLTKDARLVSKVKSAALYPTIVLITAGVVGGGISYFILPKLAKLFTSFKAGLPLATRILLKISNSLQYYGLWWLGGIIGAILLVYFLLKIPFVQTISDYIKLRLPIVGRLIRSLNLARFSLTLGTLLKNSVTIDEALAITRDAITSIPYKKIIDLVLVDVKKGKTVVESLDAHDPKGRLFSATARAMVRVGETTGSLYDSLLYIAEYYEEEVDNVTKDLATSLEPILLIFIAIIVAFIAIAIITPMYSILGVVK